MRRHKRARIGVALFGLVTAGIVYVAMRDRVTPGAPAPISRMDPKSVLEITQGLLQGMTGVEKNFEITWDSLGTYADGSTKYNGIQIVVRKGENRTLKVSAREGKTTGREQVEIELFGQRPAGGGQRRLLPDDRPGDLRP